LTARSSSNFRISVFLVTANMSAQRRVWTRQYCGSLGIHCTRPGLNLSVADPTEHGDLSAACCAAARRAVGAT
jgi:hypothetical protein